MRLAWAFIKRDFLIVRSYRMAFALQLGGILVAVPIFYFLGDVFGDASSGYLEKYGGNFFAFLLIGIAFLDYHAISLRSFSQSVRDSQLTGTLELVLLSPTSLTQVLLYSSLWVYLFTSVRFLLYLLVGILFGLELQQANVPAALATLLLGVASFASLGIFSASAIMLIKRGESINVALAMTSLFLGGVLYPIEVMPGWLQALSKFLPITHALEAMRMALIAGQPTLELVPNFLILALFAIVLFPLSLASFSAAVKRTKATGTLGQY
jgi:ABC-2 type transport system permease protein